MRREEIVMEVRVGGDEVDEVEENVKKEGESAPRV